MSRRHHAQMWASVVRSTTETVQGTALALQSIDDIERGDGLALRVLGVGDGITDDALQEGLEYAPRLFVDHCGLLAIWSLVWETRASSEP